VGPTSALGCVHRNLALENAVTEELSFGEQPLRVASIENVDGIAPELAARLPGFADFGIDLATLIEAVREAGPAKGPATPGWPETMSRYGESAMSLGEVVARTGNNQAAERAFLEASFWFFFARFPTF
jgi:hypothetical protein